MDACAGGLLGALHKNDKDNSAPASRPRGAIASVCDRGKIAFKFNERG
jgi:hypothetical protein